MGTYQENNKTWTVRFKITKKGNAQWITKRGFRTRREAQAWEAEKRLQMEESLDMSFDSFTLLYQEDMEGRLKETTRALKDHIIATKLIPCFGQMRMSEISSLDILRWQNDMMKPDPITGKKLSQAYLRTINSQLNAIFNHAVRYYDLKKNPVAQVKSMGKKAGGCRGIWSRDDFQKFSEWLMDDPASYYAFQILFWCGLREGEMLALTVDDFDFVKGTVTVSKTLTRINGKDLVTPPKTDQSNRTVVLPKLLAQELLEHIEMFGLGEPGTRVFPVTKNHLQACMRKGSEAVGINRIRIHDLRHSHVSMLIDLGYSPVAVAARLGHESVHMTYQYAHLLPSAQEEMAKQLEEYYV